MDIFPVINENGLLLNNEDIDPEQNYYLDNPYRSCYQTPSSLATTPSSTTSLFSLIQINCRNILSKVSQINDLLNLSHASILALSETWLSADSDNQFNMPGYKFIHKPREKGQGEWDS